VYVTQELQDKVRREQNLREQLQNQVNCWHHQGWGKSLKNQVGKPDPNIVICHFSKEAGPEITFVDQL